MLTRAAPAECVLTAACLLGESPVWCEREQLLYWVDIRRPSVHSFDPCSASWKTWPMTEEVTCIGLQNGGGAILGLRSGVACFDFQSGQLSERTPLVLDSQSMRLNDGRCDRYGRFWVGSLHEERAPGTAALYRINPDRSWNRLVEGVTVSNGIAWSPDNRIMYFADSWTRQIFSFDFDLESGSIHNQRVFAEVPLGAGVPDGATVDTEGCLWSANFDGGCITRYSPQGKLDRTIPLPVQRPTSCAFGGKDLGVLFVTSASFGLSDQQTLHAPLAGGLFAVDVGVKGLPEPRFAQIA